METTQHLQQEVKLLVSVIIPNYNHGRYLNKAIDSVLAQTYSPHEIIVVDDGSIDDSVNIVLAYKNKVHLIQQANQGVSAARNAGAKKATGTLLAFLDADDVWMPEKLEIQMQQFSGNSNLGLVHCGVVEIDSQGNFLREHLDGMAGKVAQEMLLFRRPVILGGGSGVMIPHAVFNSLGGFDIALSTSADWDLYFRIAQQYQVGFVPKLLLQYRVHGENMHGNIDLMRKDMLHAFKMAFKTTNPDLIKIRRYSYSRLHLILAGSFYQATQYQEFIKHACKSILLSPKNALYLMKYPYRRMQRCLAAKVSTL